MWPPSEYHNKFSGGVHRPLLAEPVAAVVCVQRNMEDVSEAVPKCFPAAHALYSPRGNTRRRVGQLWIDSKSRTILAGEL